MPCFILNKYCLDNSLDVVPSISRMNAQISREQSPDKGRTVYATDDH